MRFENNLISTGPRRITCFYRFGRGSGKISSAFWPVLGPGLSKALPAASSPVPRSSDNEFPRSLTYVRVRTSTYVQHEYINPTPITSRFHLCSVYFTQSTPASRTSWPLHQVEAFLLTPNEASLLANFQPQDESRWSALPSSGSPVQNAHDSFHWQEGITEERRSHGPRSSGGACWRCSRLVRDLSIQGPTTRPLVSPIAGSVCGRRHWSSTRKGSRTDRCDSGTIL